MRKLIIAICLWLLRKAGHQFPKQVNLFLNPYTERAKQLCREQQQGWPERSGEGKRHQVYARLLKEFPSANKRDIAIAIEMALD